MKIYKIAFITIFSMLLSASCSDDFMNIKPPTEILYEDIWKEHSLAEAYMFDVYFTFQDAGFSEELQASACDEAMFTHGREFLDSNAGALNTTNQGWFGKTASGHQWKRLYTNIRSCNEFILNLDDATFDDQPNPEKKKELKDQLKGEAYFLRAYFFHRLTRAFGGIPLQLRVTQLTDSQESFMIPRSSYDDCIDRITLDLDSAAILLKDREFSNTGKGRATLAAAKALKVRMLADVASDLHDEATATAKVSIFQSYGNKELLFYTKGSREDRWRAVKTAAKDLLDNPMGHTIPDFGGDGLTVEEKANAIWSFYLTEQPDHIFSRYFIETKDESGTKMPLMNGPAGYHAHGGNTPIQQFVDAFAMSDGSKFSWNDPAHKAYPYKSREPRFYATVMYDGMKWIPRPSGDYQNFDPSGTIQTGFYQLDPAKDDMYHGMDTRTGDGETWNATYTGYYLKKFINPVRGDHRNRINAIFPFIRLTEVYMRYIEACIELGELDEAKAKLNVYRKSVSMPDITTTDKDELRAIYQNECRLEFAYEEHRYWDIRRWMIAPQLPGITALNGIKVTAKLRSGVGVQSIYEHDESRWNYVYESVPLNQESRKWVDKCYYLPIHKDETNRNTKLKQNPGYID